MKEARFRKFLKSKSLTHNDLTKAVLSEEQAVVTMEECGQVSLLSLP